MPDAYHNKLSAPAGFHLPSFNTGITLKSTAVTRRTLNFWIGNKENEKV